jgi:hypothetical protein
MVCDGTKLAGPASEVFVLKADFICFKDHLKQKGHRTQ